MNNLLVHKLSTADALMKKVKASHLKVVMKAGHASETLAALQRQVLKLGRELGKEQMLHPPLDKSIAAYHTAEKFSITPAEYELLNAQVNPAANRTTSSDQNHTGTDKAIAAYNEARGQGKTEAESEKAAGQFWTEEANDDERQTRQKLRAGTKELNAFEESEWNQRIGNWYHNKPPHGEFVQFSLEHAVE